MSEENNMKLNEQALKALRDIPMAAATDDTTMILQQVHITSTENGLTLEASDGRVWAHRSITVDTPPEFIGKSILVPAQTIRGIALAALRGTSSVAIATIEPAGLTVEWENRGGTTSGASVDAWTGAKFPPEKWIDRQSEEIDRIVLAPKLLAQAAQALGINTEDGYLYGVQLEFGKPHGPVKLTVGSVGSDYAWIMPQRPSLNWQLGRS